MGHYDSFKYEPGLTDHAKYKELVCVTVTMAIAIIHNV